jgi:FAD/FMN-containing dehydrogenase
MDNLSAPILTSQHALIRGGQAIYFKAKSDYARAPLDREAIGTILRFLAAAPSPDTLLQFQPYGGAISRVSPTATAFPHRVGTLFSLQYLAHWRSEGEAAAHLGWIRDFYAAMRPYVSGYAYSNNCDLELEDWGRAYYGANFAELMAVKARYDPDNVFRFAQSIPPAG